MKKITLIMFAIMATFIIQAQTPEVQITLSQSVGTNYLGNGLVCGDDITGITAENFWFRSYELGAYGVTGDVELKGVEFIPMSLKGDAEVTVYAWDFVGFPLGFDLSNMPTPLAMGVKTLTLDDVGFKNRIEFEGVTIGNENSYLVIAVHIADGEPIMYLGTTQDHDAPNWIAAPDCGIDDPTNVNELSADAKHVIDLVIDDELSVSDVLVENISVYPNPSSDIFKINLPFSVEVLSSSLVDILGKTTGVVYNTGEMNVSALAPGVYFLNLETNLGTYTQKVVVKQ